MRRRAFAGFAAVNFFALVCACFAIEREPVSTDCLAAFLRGAAVGSVDAFVRRCGGDLSILALCIASTFGRAFVDLVAGAFAASGEVCEARA